MRKTLALLLALIIFGLASVNTAAALPSIADLYITAETVPPHHEPVVGAKVARYRAQAVADLRWGRVQWTPRLTAWGVNTWRPSRIVGHFPDSLENSDWSIEAVRYSMTHNFNVKITDHVSLTSEYYTPFEKEEWGGHGMEENYYWLVGFKVDLL